MPSTLVYPLINGHRFDYSSITLDVLGVRFNGAKAINYKETLEPGHVRGTRAQKIGRTRGKYDAEGSVELYRLEYEAITQLLATRGGTKEVPFDITVSMSEALSDIVTDKLVGCRIKTSDHAYQEGSDPLVVKVELDIMYLIENGKAALSPLQFLK